MCSRRSYLLNLESLFRRCFNLKTKSYKILLADDPFFKHGDQRHRFLINLVGL